MNPTAIPAQGSDEKEPWRRVAVTAYGRMARLAKRMAEKRELRRCPRSQGGGPCNHVGPAAARDRLDHPPYENATHTFAAAGTGNHEIPSGGHGHRSRCRSGGRSGARSDRRAGGIRGRRNIGAIAGGITGSEAGSAFDAGKEEAHWREHFHEEPYYESDYRFEDYAPAYRLGGERYRPHESFEAAEKEMGEAWETRRGESRLTWEQARPAALAGWSRMTPPIVP